jgi:hypothetical protein
MKRIVSALMVILLLGCMAGVAAAETGGVIGPTANVVRIGD